MERGDGGGRRGGGRGVGGREGGVSSQAECICNV